VLTLALEAGSGYGGAEKLAYEFARRLDAERFASYLCTIRAPVRGGDESTASDRAGLAAAGVRFIELNERHAFLSTPRAWRVLYGLLRREPIDIVHAHMPRASVPGAILARLARVPVMISHEHGSLLEGKRVRRVLDRHVVSRLSTVVLAVSEWDRRQLIELQDMAPGRVRVLPNGIAPLPPPLVDVRPELGGDPGVPLIGSVGRLYEQKGYDYLVEAVHLLARSGRPVRCVIAGIGPEQARLEELIAARGLRDRLRLIGRRSDATDVIRALDVAVLSSRWEGSPLVVMEYMAAGAPIVATAVGGVPDLIDDGVHGLLVPAQDPPALAAGIERLLDDDTLARRLGAAAQARQRSEFDLGVVVRRLERLYLELYERASRSDTPATIKTKASH
jgi:glycosyltransferase involved in cell wall biosynthesis